MLIRAVTSEQAKWAKSSMSGYAGEGVGEKGHLTLV